MAITDNLQDKVRKAKSLGYSDEQISTYLGSQGVKAPPDGFGEFLKGAGKGALQTVYDASAFNAGPVGKHMLDGAPALKKQVETLVKPAMVATTPAQKAGKTTEMVAEAVMPFGPSVTRLFGRVAHETADGIASVISKTADRASGVLEESIAKNVENVLKETPSPAFDHYVQLATKATENNKNVTPLEFVGRRAEHALETIQTQLKTIGASKAELMGPGRVAVTPIDPTPVRVFREGMESLRNSLSPTGGDTALISKVRSGLNALGDTPSAGQVDKFVDHVQDLVYTAKRDLTVPVTDKLTGRIRSLTEKLNTGLKDQLPSQYRELNDAYSKLINVRNELNTKLGAEGEKGGALMKRVFSPSDANTKELFKKVHDLTGVDLVNEATLARYVMDVMGDARQKSMLQQLQMLDTSPKAGNIVGQAIHYVMEHFNKPEEIIKRARAHTIGGASQ